MQTLSKQEFVERHGDPANFTFKGQCYDAGSTSGVKCTLCGRQTRFVYILKDPEDRSTPTGPECFHYWKKWNPHLYTHLKGAAIWMDAVVEGEARDSKVFSHRTEVQEKIKQWREIKRKALAKIREYKQASKKEWLPEKFYELQAVVAKAPAPSATMRWYDNRIKELTEKIHKVSV